MSEYSEQASADYADFSANLWREFFSHNVQGNKKLVAGYLSFVESMFARQLPPIFEERHLAHLLGITLNEQRYLTSDYKALYNAFQIPKRSGGQRIIEAPIAELAHAQRWIDFNVSRKIACSAKAFGYVQGRSNLENARQHLGRHAVLHLDLVDFFHAISTTRVTKVFSELGYPPVVATIMARICTRHGRLPQGSPASPQIANIAFLEADNQIDEFCQVNGLIYSRYVDDLNVSGPFEALVMARVAISEICSRNGFEINENKTYIQKGKKKIVTGISIGSGKARLPRALKRRFSFQIFSYIKTIESSEIDELHPMFLEKAKGMLAYWRFVEPENRSAKRLSEQLAKAESELSVRRN